MMLRKGGDSGETIDIPSVKGQRELMARTAAFHEHTERYDQWFVRHDGAYLSELLAVRRLLPQHGLGIEIGVGTGRFAAALGIPLGLDPCINMLRKARGRHLLAVGGIAEALPFVDEAFDYCLVVTTICFVDDARTMMYEARRVLKPNGRLVVGFVDRDSPLGQHYLARQLESVFYRDATFYSVADVEALLTDAGFRRLSWAQTLFRQNAQNTAIEETCPGHGRGSFVVVSSVRPS